MRESEIHFSRWIFNKKERNWLNIILISAFLHAFTFFLLHFIKPKPEIALDQKNSTIKINFSNLKEDKSLIHNKKLQENSIQNEYKNRGVLTDTKKNSKSNFSTKEEIRAGKVKNKEKINSHSQSPIKQNDSQPQKKIDNLKSFLPSGNSDYLNELRQNDLKFPSPSQVNGGDIPIEGPSLAPTNEPRVVHRYAEKDMSLFQFTQEFRERFSSIWNSEERNVPPSSPLHPGDVVFYRVYINSNGTLDKFVNLSSISQPNKNYSEIDKLFSQVVNRVFPMVVPPKFARKNIVLTQDLAIQVVDRNSPIRFSF